MSAETRNRAEYHGVVIDDSYDWLRDPGYPEVTDDRILGHLTAENDRFAAWLRPMTPLVDRLFGELKGRVKQDDQSVPLEINGWLYQWRFAEGAQYRRWYRWPASGGPEQLILDEPALAEGKGYFRLGAFEPSPDGKLLAYSFDESGGERFMLYVKDLSTGAVLSDVLSETLGPPAWSADSRRFAYVVLNAEWRPFQARLHTLGEPIERDATIFDEKEANFRVSVWASQSCELILIGSGDHVTTEVSFVPAVDPLATPIVIAPRRIGVTYDADHGGGALYIRVDDTHRNFRVVRASIEAPGEWHEIIAGSDEHYIRKVTPFARLLAIEDRIAGLDQIRLRRPDGAEHYVAFPDAAYTVGLGSNPSPDPDRLRLEYSSLVRPATTFELDPTTGTLTTLKVQEIPSGYAADDYIAERLHARARDGVLIPISLVRRKDWIPGGPLHLYGYGAYGLGMEPGFAAARISLLDRGFAYAIAHIRGGDEMGRAWHDAGKLGARWNTFNDFIDSARFLVAEGYAKEGSISTSGGSAGGQLMGVVANEAPELWRAVIAHVPFVDALNTMLDPSLPLTPPEWPEWGNPIEDRAAFDYIRSYSPYDNVRPQHYPPILATAGLSDPRVTYREPAKWVAKLRATKTDDNLLLLKTNMGAGHGGKPGRFDRLREVAEEYAFVLAAFGMASVS